MARLEKVVSEAEADKQFERGMPGGSDADW